MATVFFAWELGGGLGHLMRMAPMATALVAKGHRVFLTVRDLSRAESLYAGSGVEYLPAPYFNGQIEPVYRSPISFAHILHNVGFGDERCLSAHAAAWRNMYELTKPDLIVFDHSPTALLAARSVTARRLVIGSGFCIPPDVHPFPSIREEVPYSCQQLCADEDRLLARINRLLEGWRQPPLARVGQLFSQVDEQFLTTFAELDHYPERQDARYWGPINRGEAGGKEPSWPTGDGKRVFAYLKPFPAIARLFEILNQMRLPTLAYVDGMPGRRQPRHDVGTLRFASERVDIERAARQCDLAITNATLGTTTMMLMAGKPLLLLPLALEQSIMAKLVQKHSAGLFAFTNEPQRIIAQLRKLVNELATFEKGAARLAENFAHFDPERQYREMMQRIDELLPRASTSVPTAALPTVRIVLLIRRSKSYFQNGRIDALDVLSPVRAKKAEAAFEWWERTFKFPYIEFRKRVRALAAPFHVAAKFDEIIPWFDEELVRSQPPGTWLVPIDEDDWIDPKLTDELRNVCPMIRESLVTWDVVRKNADGSAKNNPNPFVESCGYAVKLPCDWQQIEDHMTLGRAKAGIPRLPCRHLAKVLAVRNQTPASLGLFFQNEIRQLPSYVAKAKTATPEAIPDVFRPTWETYQGIIEQLASSVQDSRDDARG